MGQRFALPHRILQRTYSPLIRDFALEFYTFLADNYAPYYAMPIECTDRDAPFVLDGLLYNETDLDLEEPTRTRMVISKLILLLSLY